MQLYVAAILFSHKIEEVLMSSVLSALVSKVHGRRKEQGVTACITLMGYHNSSWSALSLPEAAEAVASADSAASFRNARSSCNLHMQSQSQVTALCSSCQK